MKNIKKEQDVIYLEKYDVHVNRYLTYAQIQQIVDSTLALMHTQTDNGTKRDSWAERQQNIDMLILYHATDLTEKDLEIPHYVLLQSGLIDEVKQSIYNYNDIQLAFEYAERWDTLLLSALENIKKLIKLNDIRQIREDVKNGKTEK